MNNEQWACDGTQHKCVAIASTDLDLPKTLQYLFTHEVILMSSNRNVDDAIRVSFELKTTETGNPEQEKKTKKNSHIKRAKVQWLTAIWNYFRDFN